MALESAIVISPLLFYFYQRKGLGLPIFEPHSSQEKKALQFYTQNIKK